MKYFKDKFNSVYSYESNEDMELAGVEGLEEMTEAEINEHVNPKFTKMTPQLVTKAQGKSVLIISGMWDQILDYVSSIDDPQRRMLAEVALNDTTHWNRDSPFLNEAAQHIGLTEEQLDDLFIQAAEISL